MQTITANTGAYPGGVIEELNSWIDLVKVVEYRNFAGLITKIRHNNIRHQPLIRISTVLLQLVTKGFLCTQCVLLKDND